MRLVVQEQLDTPHCHELCNICVQIPLELTVTQTLKRKKKLVGSLKCILKDQLVADIRFTVF